MPSRLSYEGKVLPANTTHILFICESTLENRVYWYTGWYTPRIPLRAVSFNGYKMCEERRPPLVCARDGPSVSLRWCGCSRTGSRIERYNDGLICVFCCFFVIYSGKQWLWQCGVWFEYIQKYINTSYWCWYGSNNVTYKSFIFNEWMNESRIDSR